MRVEWADRPDGVGLWWRKRRGDIVCDVVQVDRNDPTFDGARVSEIGVGGSPVWTDAQLAEYQWRRAVPS